MPIPSRAERFRAFIKRWALPFAVEWTLATLSALFVPGDYIPDSSLLEADKLVHFLLFAGFAGFWMIALDGKLPRAWVYVLILGIAYGVLTEVAQQFMEGGRQGDPLDAVADSLGVIAGVGAFRLWRHFHPRRPAGS